MNKKVKRDFYGFFEKVNEPKRKPNILWFDEGRQFQIKLMQNWLDDNSILIYLTHSEDK